MKKLFCSLAFLTLLLMPFCGMAADADTNSAGNPVDQFTGKYWLESTPDNQKAYLFGIDSAIAVEAFIHDQQAAKAKKGSKKTVYTLSPFEKSWMEAFKNVSREQVVEEVTKWYQDHPQSLDRPVLDVIWYELILPRLKEAK